MNKQAAGKYCCPCQEEKEEGRGRGRVEVTVSTSHSLDSPISWLAHGHKVFALKIFILCPVMSKAVNFAKAMKYGFKSQV